MLSKKRNMKAAKRFFSNAKKNTAVKPDRVTTDHHGSYPRAIKETLGKSVLHRTNQYLNNRTEQSHRH
jgi:transposase-like protein